MDAEDFSRVDWLAPWTPVADGAALAAELRREVGCGHRLHECPAVAVARRADTDDVLYFIPGHAPPLAVVHLTWRAESGPDWPHATFYPSLEAWADERMRPDHAEFSGAD